MGNFKQYAYHITPQKNEEKINKEGIKTNGERIYLTDNLDDLNEWCKILSSERKVEKLIIYEVDISGIEYKSVPCDTTKYPSEIIIEENISPNCITKIREY